MPYEQKKFEENSAERKVSLIQGINCSKPYPAPSVLEEDIRAYLETYREALEYRFFGDDTPVYGKAYDERGPHLVRAAAAFDTLTTNGIGDPQLIPGDAIHPILELVNQRDAELTNANRCPRFSDAITNYYNMLEWSLGRVTNRIQREGTNYLMDGVEKSNERALVDLESLLIQLTSAKSRVNDETLRPQSQAYRLIDDRRQVKEEEWHAEETNLAELTRNRILSGLQEVVERLYSAKGRDEDKAHRLMVVTNELMHHLSKNLGEKGLTVIGEGGQRPIKNLPDGPLHQLEAMLSILTPIVRDYQECVVLHRDLFLGKPLQLSERTVA